MTDNPVELAITQVLAAVPLRPGQESGLAVLTEHSAPFRSLSIYIGQPEARAIQAGQRGEMPTRPTTWDLLLNALATLGGQLDKAIIDRVEESRHFFATLEISQGEQQHLLSCRPSDALALVVRSPLVKLYAAEDVLAAAGSYPVIEDN